MSGGGHTEAALAKAQKILNYAKQIETLSDNIKVHMNKAMAQNRMNWLTGINNRYKSYGFNVLTESKAGAVKLSQGIEDAVDMLKHISGIE